MSILKAIFRLKQDVNQENDQNRQEQEQHLQEHQTHLQEQYEQIDEEHKISPNPTLQEVEDKLNDRF